MKKFFTLLLVAIISGYPALAQKIQVRPSPLMTEVLRLNDGQLVVEKLGGFHTNNVIPPQNLANGERTGTKFLRDDGTWATASADTTNAVAAINGLTNAVVLQSSTVASNTFASAIGTNGNTLTFYSAYDTNTVRSTNVFVTPNGYVGFGTTNPTSPVTVYGNVEITGNTTGVKGKNLRSGLNSAPLTLWGGDNPRGAQLILGQSDGSPWAGVATLTTGTNTSGANAVTNWVATTTNITFFVPIIGPMYASNISGVLPAGTVATNAMSQGGVLTSPDGTNRAWSQSVYINPTNGYVGIGTANPTTPLTVNGNASFGSGTVNAGYFRGGNNSGSTLIYGSGSSTVHGGGMQLFGNTHATRPGEVAIQAGTNNEEIVTITTNSAAFSVPLLSSNQTATSSASVMTKGLTDGLYQPASAALTSFASTSPSAFQPADDCLSNYVAFSDCYTFDTTTNKGWIRLIHNEGYGFSGDMRLIQHDGYDQDMLFRLDVADVQTPSLIQFGSSIVADSMIDLATLIENGDFTQDFWIHTTQTNLQVDVYTFGPLMAPSGNIVYNAEEFPPCGDTFKTIAILPGVVFSDGASIEELRLTDYDNATNMAHVSYASRTWGKGIVSDVPIVEVGNGVNELSGQNGTNTTHVGGLFLGDAQSVPTVDELYAGPTNFIFRVIDGKLKVFWTTNGTDVSSKVIVDPSNP